MNSNSLNRRAAASALTLLVAAAALSAGCRREAPKGAGAAGGQTASAQQPAAPADIRALDGDIERLERQAERNPADDETRHELARAYVRRAKLEQGEGRHQEALVDYQRALRHDPDNDDAQSGAATATDALGGAKEDENGAPAPLPITPNVADEEGKPSPTPKKQ
jgi:cytochrome c-type biogenesis protein CcmH/NrfG